MTMPAVWWCCAVLAAVGLAWGWIVRRAPIGERWRPRSLRTAELLYVERTFRSRSLRIVARLDRAYRRNGVITLVEFKTRSRHQVHDSDVIELSAQRVALEDETGGRVAATAYVVTQDLQTRRRVAHPVRLLPRRELARLMVRRQQVIDGSAVATPARSDRMCAQCAHLRACSSTYRDRDGAWHQGSAAMRRS